jgi:hypothetical protein
MFKFVLQPFYCRIDVLEPTGNKRGFALWICCQPAASSVAYPVVHQRADLTIQHYIRASGYRPIYKN